MKTDLTQLANVNFDGIKTLVMGPNSILWSDLSPVKFVPEGQVLPSIYHTKNRRQFWFSEQISRWVNQNNYWNPWQSNDTLPLQFITNGLSPVVVDMYSCAGTLISSTTLTLKSSTAIVSPYALYEGVISLLPCAGSANGGYYLRVKAGAVGSQAFLISEGLEIRDDWPDTLLFRYTHSVNKQSMIFDTGFQGNFRVKGFFDNMFKQKYKGAFYTDEPADISILNAFSYETTSLVIGEFGVPDYATKIIANIMLLDGTLIEGEGFSMNEGAEWEEIFTVGSPMKFQKLDIRPSSTSNATSATPSGIDTSTSVINTVDALAFAPNAGGVPGDSQITNVVIS